MNAATLLAVFFVPVLYFVIQSYAERKKGPVQAPIAPPVPEGSV
jgi:hypothetical protein